MPSLGRITRKILNLPESEPAHSTPAGTGGWEDAAARLKAAETSTAPAAPADRREPWTVQEERSGTRFARRFGRGLLWLVVALAALTGVREWIHPTTEQGPPVQSGPVEYTPAFPTDDAQAVAARYARAYLTWDEDNPDQRAALLAADLPKDADLSAGWDGNGQQSVLWIQPGKVTTTGETTARVQVTALVESDPSEDGDKNDKKADPAQSWMTLEVPVAVTGGRVVVTGNPGLIGVPASGPRAPKTKAAETDMQLSSATRGTVEDFFVAYAAGDISAELAPGSTLPALPDGTALESLQNWTVDDGRGDQRYGTATVVWRLSGAQLTQTYRVQLTRVSAPGGQRWQVADVLGGQA